MPEELVRALLTVVFGALAGGVTNSLAIWMLFHPYEPPRILGRRLEGLQGAVPKNQARLAAAIGRTVGDRLLTEEDLTRTFRDPAFREAFDERLAGFLDVLLHQERGSLREILPPGVLPELERMLEEIAERGVERLEGWIGSEEFTRSMEERADGIVGTVAGEPVSDLLTPAREAAFSATVEEWLAGAVESPGFRSAVEEYLDGAARSLLRPGRTFEEVLPAGLVGAVERGISSYLPLAIQRLGSLLDDPDARNRFEEFLHDLLHRFLRDLKFHERVVARLILREDTVDRVLEAVEEEGTERLSEMLRDPAVRDAMARGVRDAIVDFLRKPVTSVLGTADDPDVVEVRDTVTEWIVDMARDPATRTFLLEKLEAGVERAGARTWGEVFERIPPERLAGWVVTAARSDVAGRLYREGARRVADEALDRPIGTPARLLPSDAARRIEAALGDPLWEWLQTQVPDVVSRIDVARRVEQKVLDFPTPRMEELVRRVTERELRLIVKLGYLLGALIGGVLLGVNALLA